MTSLFGRRKQKRPATIASSTLASGGYAAYSTDAFAGDYSNLDYGTSSSSDSSSSSDGGGGGGGE